jgi:hypothetical protein
MVLLEPRAGYSFIWSCEGAYGLYGYWEAANASCTHLTLILTLDPGSSLWVNRHTQLGPDVTVDLRLVLLDLVAWDRSALLSSTG